jgi:hypothetical protein
MAVESVKASTRGFDNPAALFPFASLAGKIASLLGSFVSFINPPLLKPQFIKR